jgi:hypothetical protein
MLAVAVLALVSACSDQSSAPGASTGPTAPGEPASPTATTIAGEPEPSDADTTSSSTSSTSSTSTTTTIPLVVEGAIVKVANASEVDGAAAKLTDELTAKGFTLSDPSNAAGIEAKLDVSKVYFAENSYPVAESLARLLGGLQVAPMPTPVWIKGANEALDGATVVVMLGRDLAGTDIPGVSS